MSVKDDANGVSGQHATGELTHYSESGFNKKWRNVMKHSTTSVVCSIVLGIASLCVATATQATAEVQTNLLPYVLSFEGDDFIDGSNIVDFLGWETDDLEAVKALSNSEPLPSYPLVTNHTTVASLNSDVTIHVDGSTYAGNDNWVDFLVKPKRWEEESAPTEIPTNTQLAIFVDTNNCLNIYHAVNGWEEGYPTFPGGGMWSVVSAPEFAVPENEWIRLSINVNYTFADYSSGYFRMKLNGEMITHTNAHFAPEAFDYFQEDVQPGDNAGPGIGTWFPLATLMQSSQISAIDLRGTGLFDDFVINDTDPAVSNIFYYIITPSINIAGAGTIEPVNRAKKLPGENQTFTWAPTRGFFFSSVDIGENGVTNHYTSQYPTDYTFTNVSADGSVMVNFATLQSYTIMTSATNGSITPSGSNLVYNTDVLDFTWTNNYGSQFSDVTIAYNGVTNNYTAGLGYDNGCTLSNVTADGSIAVIFTNLPTFNITASATNGTISPTDTVAVPVGYNKEFSWTAERGYEFESVTIGENGVTNVYTTNHVAGYTFNNVTNSGSVAVSFKMLPRYTIVASASGGVIDPSGTITNIIQGESQAFTWYPTPGLGYRFLSVTIGENGSTNDFMAGYESGYEFSNVSADGSIAVTFEEIPRTPGLRNWLQSTGLGLDFVMTPAAWEAYISSTDPTNSAFRFEVTSISKVNGTNFVQWKSIYVDTNLPPFRIEAATNLGSPTVYVLTGTHVRVAGSPVYTNNWSQPAPAYPVYYRVVATNNVYAP